MTTDFWQAIEENTAKNKMPPQHKAVTVGYGQAAGIMRAAAPLLQLASLDNHGPAPAVVFSDTMKAICPRKTDQSSPEFLEACLHSVQQAVTRLEQAARTAYPGISPENAVFAYLHHQESLPDHMDSGTMINSAVETMAALGAFKTKSSDILDFTVLPPALEKTWETAFKESKPLKAYTEASDAHAFKKRGLNAFSG